MRLSRCHPIQQDIKRCACYKGLALFQQKIIFDFSCSLRQFFFPIEMLQILQEGRNQLIRLNCTTKDDRVKCFVVISLLHLFDFSSSQITCLNDGSDTWLIMLYPELTSCTSSFHLVGLLLMMLTSTSASFVILSLLKFAYKSFSHCHNVKGILQQYVAFITLIKHQ